MRIAERASTGRLRTVQVTNGAPREALERTRGRDDATVSYGLGERNGALRLRDGFRDSTA